MTHNDATHNDVTHNDMTGNELDATHNDMAGNEPNPADSVPADAVPAGAHSWVEGAAGSGFDVDHLPYGVFAVDGGFRRVGVRIGDFVLDLASAAPDAGDLAPILKAGILNPLMSYGPAVWRQVRDLATGLLTDPSAEDAVRPHLYRIGDVELFLPIVVADYVDFYASEHHATAVGRLFRPDSEPLLPNWKHLPVGYHGRAGTVIGSGTEVIRPCGQRKPPGDPAPTFGPSRRLDIEAEVGFVVGVPSALGQPVGIADFADHVFGVCLVNDWSARDIQAWEYVPLGPFLGKSFATSMSLWVTPLAALQAARTAPPPRTVPLLDYLADDPEQPWGLDLSLQVEWNGTVVSRPPFATMYYTPAQMLAQMTANGASTRNGDLYASGTVSGPGPGTAGSFLELSVGGAEPITLANGQTRTFLQDGDTVTISATAPSVSGGRLQLAEVTGTIRPARC